MRTAFAGPRPLQLPELLESAIEDDYYEEDAYEWLEKVGATPVSHSRRYLYNVAWHYGWRPSRHTGVRE